ncbi:DNA-deoxyinosine glycosylase [Nitrosomonas communis]|uniref:Hypoxanthine-DNA glycosylase n=1 Tax=Nitrosomonas communis TaxID=44574 RepID=A0A1I4V1E0_9PROT|nr:DNA-deoxyinosine glycosylase [Nitrosomonas communis]SFM95018.1 hypoxanthine-DNA glycosylase [Nitrosomonas communis]
MKNEFIIALPPILPKRAHTLILGSIPGAKSLELNQYYAHPQNQFWRFMGDIFGASPSIPYEERIKVLKQKGIAVWDVLKACNRYGSMDADIKNPVVNDFECFYQDNPSIKLVVFDSSSAENFYKRLVQPTLSQELIYRRVPSPSPAHARMNYEAKRILWMEALSDRVVYRNSF